MDDKEPPKLLIVDPVQYNQGWLENRDGFIWEHRFVLIRCLEDGNYEVQNPAWIMREKQKYQEESEERTRMSRARARYRKMYPGLDDRSL